MFRLAGINPPMAASFIVHDLVLLLAHSPRATVIGLVRAIRRSERTVRRGAGIDIAAINAWPALNVSAGRLRHRLPDAGGRLITAYAWAAPMRLIRTITCVEGLVLGAAHANIAGRLLDLTGFIRHLGRCLLAKHGPGLRHERLPNGGWR